MLFPSFFNAGKPTYEIEQSLRFDGSSYLSRTFNSSESSTFSVWVKRGDLAGTNNIFGARQTSGSTYRQLFFEGASPFGLGGDNVPSQYAYTNNALRDPSAWYHIVYSTGSNDTRIWINGVEASYRLDTNGDGGSITNSPTAYLGSGWNNANKFNGYMAEFHHIDGQQLDPDNFGEYDDNGVWRPKRYTGSYGTNGFYLKFDPTATNGIGHDHSGNGNNFTPSGFTTSGTGTDVMSDTPTKNFCTWNPLDNTGVTLKNGNLDFGYAGAQDCGGTFALSSGKWYWEIEVRDNIGTGGQPLAHGIHNASVTSDFRKQAIWFYTDEISAGEVRRYANNSVAATVSIPSALRAIDIGDYVQVAYDADSGKVWFAVNNTWMDGSGGTSGNPGSGSNPVFTLPDTSIPMTPWRSHAGLGWEGFTNFGQRAFAYTPPTGFKSLNTANLPAPTVKDGSENFSANLWSGNNTTNTALTGFGHAPDLTWIKARNYAFANVYFDSIRGGSKRLYNTGTTPPAQDTNTEYLKSFDSDGITLGSDANVNYSTANYVGHSWKGGGTVSADNNTDGTITTTVSANSTGGFSVIKYTSNGTSGATIGHGLGVAPAFFIIKNIDASDHYAVYHQGIGNTKALLLNSANNVYTGSVWWNNTSPSSSVITLGNETSVNNTSSDDYICWAWAEVEGYSKFGSYTGNGSTDGPFIATSFAPAIIIIKKSGAANWVLMDKERYAYNPRTQVIYPNDTSPEVSLSGVADIDFLSNGFKIRRSWDNINASGTTYVFMAFAENPFGGDGVSPATAR